MRADCVCDGQSGRMPRRALLTAVLLLASHLIAGQSRFAMAQDANNLATYNRVAVSQPRTAGVDLNYKFR